MSNIKNILIIGSGISGSSSGYLINCFLKYVRPNIKITLFDKAQKSGGRLTTYYIKNNKNFFFELGFKNIPRIEEYNIIKYLRLFTYNNFFTKSENYYKNVIGFTDIFETNSLKEINCKYNKRVTDINIINNNNKFIWEVKTHDHKTKNFDIIISTIPVPQLLDINGNFKDNFDNHLFERLNNVKYNNIISASFLYQFNDTKELPNWKNIYTSNSDKIINWISKETLNLNNILYSKLIIHSTPEFANENFNNNSKTLQQNIIENLNKYLVDFNSNNISDFKIQKWKYANVINDSELSHTYKKNAILSYNKLPFIIGGDSVCGSNVISCLKSSEEIFNLTQNIIIN